MKHINVYYKTNKGERVFLVVLDDCDTIAEAIHKTQTFYQKNTDHYERFQQFIQEPFVLSNMIALYEEEEVDIERKNHWRYNIKNLN